MSVRSQLGNNLIRKFRAGKAVLEKPMLESRGAKAVKLLRTGTRGISDQFKDETEYRGSGSSAWKKTQPFGTRKAPRKTMQASGLYRAAWLGGAGGTEKIEANSITIGVEADKFPRVKIHQGSAASVRVFPKKRTKGGKDWKMRFFLGLTYGVWLTRARIEKGLEIARRRLSVSTDVRKAVARMVAAETKKKLGVGVQGPRAVA